MIDGTNAPQAFWTRHYRPLAVCVLGLAVFNLTYRLGSELVTEWDESLYAIPAWEALENGSWIGTTFLGALDYYNSKPPLMVWLIAGAFKLFGPSLLSLRVVPAASAWLTVAVLQVWTRRCLGDLVSLLASLVLATTFGFVSVHSGRHATTDAAFTLVVLLIVVTLWAEAGRPGLRLWLGPLLAAAFLLRGMAVLMPFALVVAVLARRPRHITPWGPSVSAIGLFLLPVGAWAVARYQLDGWRFFERLFLYDFVARTVRPLEGHPGGLFYYLDILLKHQYEWLLAAGALWLLCRRPRHLDSTAFAGEPRPDGLAFLLRAWAAVTLVIPMVMRTKMPWYLNTFYPLFAIGIASILADAIESGLRGLTRWRPAAYAATIVLALGVAEGKLLYYSFHYRDVGLSRQSIMLAERGRLRGHHLYLEPHTRAGYFVAGAVVGATPERGNGLAAFLRDSQEGSYLLIAEPCRSPELETVRSDGVQFLCRKPGLIDPGRLP